MTACPHCQRALPSDLTGTNCPACKKALPIALVRSVNPTVTETPALGQARPVRPVHTTPAEDRWDDGAGNAPSAKGLPTSAGLPGAANSPRRGGATKVMGSEDVLAAEKKRDPIPAPAAAPRAAGERETNDLVARVTGEHTKPARAAQKPTAAGLPGAVPRARSGNATIVGGSPLLGPQTAPDPSSDDETNALRVDPAPVSAIDPSDSGDETSALRVDQLEARIPGDLPSNRPPARPATTLDAGESGDETGVLRADQLDARVPGDLPSERPSPARPATTADAPLEIASASSTGARKPAAASPPKSPPSATTSNPGAATGPRPVLASDMLREDLVPHEPARQALRAVLALSGVVLVALAAISMRDPAQAIAWAIPGLTALAVVIAPATYGTRALLPFAPASAALLMQAIAVPGARVPAAVVFTITAGGLPAALFYRSFFRASRRARAFVAVGLLAAVVWLQLPGGGAVFESGHGSWAMAHVPALALVGVSLLSLLAFVGADTTAGCRAWATLAIAWAGFAALAQRTVLAGAAVDREAWTSALATSALAAITALSGAALLALYSRPTAPRTGIGAAASQH